MEVPEKLYVHVKKGKALNIWNSEWVGVNDIKYIRKDAFIEKACSGIEKLLSGYIIRNFHFGDSYDINKLIEDFKEYMKGE